MSGARSEVRKKYIPIAQAYKPVNNFLNQDSQDFGICRIKAEESLCHSREGDP